MSVAARPAADTRSSTISQTLFHLQRKELAEAASLLTRALARSPDDPAFLHLLGTVRRLERQPAEAEELYRRSLASLAAQPHVHRDLGKLLASLGRMEDAIAEFREAIRLKPVDANAHLCLAAGLARREEYAAAEASYCDVLRLNPAQTVARLGLAEVLCHLNRPAEAERVLREVPSPREPALAAALAHRLGIALKQQMKYAQALTLFDAAQAHQPDFPAVDYVRGETLQQMGQWEQAAACFRKVLAQRPDHANASGCLALIAALSGDFAEARNQALKTLAHAPGHEVAHVALALVEIEDRDFAAAAERLRGILENPAVEKAAGTAVVAGFAADAFDRHRRYPEAFAVARASKAMLRDLWSETGPRATEVARVLTNYFERSEPWSASARPRANTEQPAGHVFLLGFLRSGTTLIETVLAAGRNVAHADEIDFLDDAARAFLMNNESLDRLAKLANSEIAAWHQNYWNAVRAAHLPVAGKIFIDKMPINTFRLPLIARLFPAAKIVFAVRDPRDVVLSCFRRHFDPTPYSREFLRLEDCAHLYAATMALADICRKKLPLDVLELRYENIIDDFDPTIRGLCQFAGVEWCQSMRDFRRAAETIDLRSASARQVRRGLYAGAVGHWRHYRDELVPVLPILAPWAARFGYPAE
ncbi:MAG TPA: sulfotransferase [Rhizomicrobium sp.]|nr:sulfotransferase [Rhizomicrobium sp.]